MRPIPRWFDRVHLRRGEGHAHSLFFNPLWIYGALAVLLLGVATGRIAITLLALLVLVTAGIARLWNAVCLRRVTMTRELSTDRAFPDDVITVVLTVVNRKLLPLPTAAIEDELSNGLRVIGRETLPSGTPGRHVFRILTSIRPYERVRWRIKLECPYRGVHPLGPGIVRSGDLFGFYTNRAEFPTEQTIIVYPRVRSLDQLGFPPRQPFGETAVSHHLVTDPARVIGIRDYRPEDPFRSINWKATARQSKLQVHVYQPTSSLQVGIFVNLDTFEHYWEGLDIELTEQVISIAASVATWADSQRYAVGAYANGYLVGSDQTLRVPPSRDPAQLMRVLEGLAKLSPYSTVPFPKVLQAGTSRAALGSTIVIVTPLLSDALIAVLASLVAAGHRIVFVAVHDCAAPRIPGIIIRRVAIDRDAPPLSAMVAATQRQREADAKVRIMTDDAPRSDRSEARPEPAKAGGGR